MGGFSGVCTCMRVSTTHCYCIRAGFPLQTASSVYTCVMRIPSSAYHSLIDEGTAKVCARLGLARVCATIDCVVSHAGVDVGGGAASHYGGCDGDVQNITGKSRCVSFSVCVCVVALERYTRRSQPGLAISVVSLMGSLRMPLSAGGLLRSRRRCAIPPWWPDPGCDPSMQRSRPGVQRPRAVPSSPRGVCSAGTLIVF